MSQQESAIIQELRVWNEAILRRANPSDVISARSIVTDVASIVQSTLPRAFTELSGLNLWTMLRTLKTAGEMDERLFRSLDRVRHLFGQIKYKNALPTKNDGEHALRAFAQFIEWLQGRQLAVPAARIDNIWYDCGQYDLVIHVAFAVYNFRNRKGGVLTYVHYDNDEEFGDEQLIDSDGNSVMCWGEFIPPYASAIWNNF